MDDIIFNFFFQKSSVGVINLVESSQLKSSLKVILGHWKWDYFEKNHSQFRIIESCPCLFLQKE